MKGLTRTLARCAIAAAIAEAAVAVFARVEGGFRLEVGRLHISASTWSAPLIQAALFAAAAIWLFDRDAKRRAQPAEWRRRALWAALVLGLLATLDVCLRLAHQTIVLGSREGGWVFPFVRPLGAEAMAVFAVASAAAVAMAMWDRVDRREWALVFGWICLAFGVQALLRWVAPFKFDQILASDGANSFYSVTRTVDAFTALADFDRLRATWPLHAHSNMPGKLMFLYALELVSTRPAILASLVVAVSNLGAVFQYIFVRDLFGDRRIALWSLALYLFVPGKLFFFPLLNTATPAIVLGCLVLLQRWLRTGRAAYAAAAGVAIYGQVFFEPLPLVLGVLVVLLAARALRRRELTWRAFVRQSGVLVAAFIATYVAVAALTGFHLFEALRQVSLDAMAFNAAEGRPYAVWARQNLVDFFFSAGVCQTVLFAAALGDGLAHRPWTWADVDRPILVVCVSLAAILVAIDLAGVNRGEVARLWIFLACLFQIPAAYLCARLNSRLAIALVVAGTLLQDVLGVAMVGWVVP